MKTLFRRKNKILRRIQKNDRFLQYFNNLKLVFQFSAISAKCNSSIVGEPKSAKIFFFLLNKSKANIDFSAFLRAVDTHSHFHYIIGTKIEINF